MPGRMDSTLARAAAAFLLAASLPAVTAQFDGGGNGNGGQFAGGAGGFGGAGVGFDIDQATRIRGVHGILGALAFVIFFPVGSVLMRVLPGRLALWAHAVFQVLSYVVYIAAAALGFWMVQTIQIPFQDGSMLSNASINYHPIIGIVVLVSLFFQPALGILHHRRFKRQGRRQIWSHLHLFLGRASIVLGMVNGGLGLHVSGASASLKTAYTVVAAVMGALWLLCALAAELRRCRARRRPAVPPPPPQGDPVLGSDDDDGVHERASPVVEPKL